MRQSHRMRRAVAIIAVFAGSLTILTWNAAGPGVATGYVDPVAKVQAQDEAFYGSLSLGMIRDGDWLTPRFLGRYSLTKPPVLNWLQASALKIVRNRNLAFRLPSLCAGAATTALVFWWLLSDGVTGAGALTGALLLLSSHLFFVLSRIGLTDALLTFEITLAMFALARDPRLASHAGLWTFGCATGLGLMTKGIAGLIPLLILAVLCVLSRDRPEWTRLAQAVAITAMIAMPWHLFQLWQRTSWFWAEYVMTEAVGRGIGSPLQSTHESQAGYYLKRLVALDPFLLAFAIWSLIWKRPRVPLTWIAIVLTAALSFEYRNTSYILPMFPALAILAGGAVSRKWALWALALVAILSALKGLAPTQTWGVPFAAESSIPSQATLDRYAALGRRNELIVIEPDDQFYSADLNLPHVRYVYIGPRPPPGKGLDFMYLGILITAADFSRLPELRSQFERRLHEWGLASGSASPIATTILAANETEVRALIQANPGADFFVPAPAGHQIVLSAK